MAEHADSDEQVDDDAILDESSEVGELYPEDSEVGESEAEDTTAKNVEKSARQRFSGVGALLAAGLAVVVASGGAAGWLGYRAYEAREAKDQHNVYLRVARQAAINLTTISYTEVDADIQRILDSTTGTFHEDFQQRFQPFVEVVKKVQSKSEGTVSEAGFLSETRDRAQVLLAVSVKTSTAAAPEQDPRRWRLRIDVQKMGDDAKISNVEFVA